MDLHGVTVDAGKGQVSFPAEINMTAGALEYLLVANTGKTHESLLATSIQPMDLQVAMLLLGMKPAQKMDTQPPPQITLDYLRKAPPLTGTRVDIWLDWKDPAGPHHERPERMVLNTKENRPATDGAWIYNGSEVYMGRFLAQIDGSIVALVRDSAAMMNNPRPGNDNDRIWQVNGKATPKAGTPVQVTIEREKEK